MKFAWDPRKARPNLRDHGVSFYDAWNEERFVTMGVSLRGRLLVVCHTEDDGLIRIISARQATGHETRDYESKTGP